MATTGQMSGAYGKLEIRSPSGTGSWSDISGSSQAVEQATVTRKSGKAYPLDQDYPSMTYGKQDGAEATFMVIYTESTTEAYQVALSAFEASTGTLVDVKFTPGGSTAGADTYTVTGKIISIDYPGFNGDSGDPIMCSFTVASGTITHTV
jgi:hypothetical protein